jgi:PDZ domain-containing secreted protein
MCETGTVQQVSQLRDSWMILVVVVVVVVMVVVVVVMIFSMPGGTVLTASMKSDSSCRQFLD